MSNKEKMTTLKQLFIHELQDMYDAEQRLVEALPTMQKKASNSELKTAFSDHLKQTKDQVKRLEKVFEQMGEKPKRETCKAMQGLIKEAESMLEENMSTDVRDAALITMAQKVEHYEIASYGTLATFAESVADAVTLDLLRENLSEENRADELLSSIARNVNQEAVGA